MPRFYYKKQYLTVGSFCLFGCLSFIHKANFVCMPVFLSVCLSVCIFQLSSKAKHLWFFLRKQTKVIGTLENAKK